MEKQKQKEKKNIFDRIGDYIAKEICLLFGIKPLTQLQKQIQEEDYIKAHESDYIKFGNWRGL